MEEGAVMETIFPLKIAESSFADWQVNSGDWVRKKDSSNLSFKCQEKSYWVISSWVIDLHGMPIMNHLSDLLPSLISGPNPPLHQS